MASYEMVTILSPTVTDDLIPEVAQRVGAIVEHRGAEITKTDIWGRRRLAYTLNNHREGIYVLYNFSAPETTTHEIESQLRITEDVLRHMLVRLDD